MNDPLVSVIIAVHDGEQTLAAAIESLLGQDYSPFEVIVVDDGSGDRSGEIARAFEGVSVLRQDNQGPGAARNAGVAVSRGDLVTFLDADDLAMPSRLTLQVDHLRRRPDVGCVLGRQEVEFLGIEPPEWLARDAIFGDLEGIVFTTAMLGRETFDAVGGFDPNLKGSEDRDLMVRLRAAGVVIDVLPEIVIRRRFTGSNLTLRQPGSMLLTSLRSKLDRERAAAPDLGETVA